MHFFEYGYSGGYRNLSFMTSLPISAAPGQKSHANIKKYKYFGKRIQFATIWDQPQASILICSKVMLRSS